MLILGGSPLHASEIIAQSASTYFSCTWTQNSAGRLPVSSKFYAAPALPALVRTRLHFIKRPSSPPLSSLAQRSIRRQNRLSSLFTRYIAVSCNRTSPVTDYPSGTAESYLETWRSLTWRSRGTIMLALVFQIPKVSSYGQWCWSLSPTQSLWRSVGLKFFGPRILALILGISVRYP